MRRLWIVVVFEGRRLRFAPELYPTQLRAEREAYRWGWFLAGGDQAKIQTVDEHHWKVGRANVGLIASRVWELPPDAELWVGVSWGKDGRMRSAGVFLGKGHAMTWLRALPTDPNIRPGIKDHGMFLSINIKYGELHGGGELTAIAMPAKVAASFDGAIAEALPEIAEASDYEVDLVATFSHVIHTTLRAEPGLTAEGISDRIDREFPNLIGYQGQLVDASWELEEFRERGPRRPKPVSGAQGSG
jgi:hypothetical protein